MISLKNDKKCVTTVTHFFNDRSICVCYDKKKAKGEYTMKLSVFMAPQSFTSYSQLIDFCVKNHITGLELFPMFEKEGAN